MFNANVVPVTVSLNNGSPFSIGATSAAIKFRPQVPAIAPVFVAGPATPGTIGAGSNTMSITPSGWTNPQAMPFEIPAFLQITSLQIYIFWNSQNSGVCIAFFANGGQLFSSTSQLVGTGQTHR